VGGEYVGTEVEFLTNDVPPFELVPSVILRGDAEYG
jgi:hypothetical protein